MKTLKRIEINYYSTRDFPAIGEIIKKNGRKYKVIENNVRNVTIAEEVKESKPKITLRVISVNGETAKDKQYGYKMTIHHRDGETSISGLANVGEEVHFSKPF